MTTSATANYAEIERVLGEVDAMVKLSPAFRPHSRGRTLWSLIKTAIESRSWVEAEAVFDDFQEVLNRTVAEDNFKKKWRHLATLAGRMIDDKRSTPGVVRAGERGSDNHDQSLLHSRATEPSLEAKARQSLQWFEEVVAALCQEISTGVFPDHPSFLQEPSAQQSRVSPLLETVRACIQKELRDRSRVEEELIAWFRACADVLGRVFQEDSRPDNLFRDIPNLPGIRVNRDTKTSLERASSKLTTVLCKMKSVVKERNSPSQTARLKAPQGEEFARLTAEYEHKYSALRRQLQEQAEELDRCKEKLRAQEGRLQSATETEAQARASRADDSGPGRDEMKSRIWQLESEIVVFRSMLDRQVARVQEVELERDNLKTRFMQDVQQGTREVQPMAPDLAGPDVEDKLQDLEAHVKDLQSRLHRKTSELEHSQMERDQLKHRLSKILGSQLTDNNPDLTDLSDDKRPVKLAEMFTQLYDNEWTDAFESLTAKHGMVERTAIQALLDTLKRVEREGFADHPVDNARVCTALCTAERSLSPCVYKDCYAFCEEERSRLLASIGGSLQMSSHSTGYTPEPELVQSLREKLRPLLVSVSTERVTEKYIETRATGSLGKDEAGSCLPFVRKCVELCWYLVLQSPQVYIDFVPPAELDEDVYRCYTRSGRQLDFVVWPPLYVCQGGARLCKGVAQPK